MAGNQASRGFSMRPDPGEVVHFSEDPDIEVFAPHVAATAHQSDAFVWAVDEARAPDYWFPRECPRAMAWVIPGSTDDDRMRILGPGGGERVHAIEHRWLPRLIDTSLFAYRFDARDFEPFGKPVAHAHVSRTAVEPLGPPEPVGDLLDLHAQAGIQLRCLSTLFDFWDDVVTSTLRFSGIRLSNGNHADRNGET
jgi:hypothetical protein